MTAGSQNLKHIAVLMMENRSFDHMLGSLKAHNTRINGLNGNETNPDTCGNPVKVQPLADYQDQLNDDPDHHFPGTDLQVYAGSRATTASPTCRALRRRPHVARRWLSTDLSPICPGAVRASTPSPTLIQVY